MFVFLRLYSVGRRNLVPVDLLRFSRAPHAYVTGMNAKPRYEDDKKEKKTKELANARASPSRILEMRTEREGVDLLFQRQENE